MSDKKIRAKEMHDRGVNCAQCVACVFAEDLGYDEKTVFELMEAFGFGMATMGTCGAVSAMATVVGMNRSDGNMEQPRTKKDCYKDMQSLTAKFQEKNSSVICREIKGVDTGVVLRSCQGCIDDAIDLLEEYLAE